MPKKLASQMILLVLFTLFSTVLLIFTIFIFETSGHDIIKDNIKTNHYLDKITAAVKVLENSKTDENLYSLNSYRVQFLVKKQAVFMPSIMTKEDESRSNKLRIILGEKHPKAYVRQLKPMEHRFYAAIIYLKDQLLAIPLEEHLRDPNSTILQIQVQLTDGRWLTMAVNDKTPFPIWIHSTVTPTVIFSIILIFFAIVVVKHITSPLAKLADNATKLGKGHIIEPIDPHGPEDVQKAIIAFNTMHKRLLNVNDHRARALAAISHDIRTPLTSMRLNAEYIAELDIQQKILEKIAEMEQICEATVTFALKDSWSEKNKHFDLISLIESLCCDLNEQGFNVSFIPQGKLSYNGKPVALKRAFSNLIRNGIEYGYKVNVFIVQVKESIEVHIVDEGPGIEESEKERLFEPFERIEPSRNRNSGGLGLGMAIARSVIRSHGGEIELTNQLMKGLDVTVVLPL